jgi:DNA-binding transcriptional ArsR family regulator
LIIDQPSVVMPNKSAQPEIEVTSQQLLNELTEIKDRVGALENVAGIANQDILVKYFAEVLNTPQRRQIMAACREPQTRDELIKRFKFNSPQALSHHMKPLREGLIHETHHNGEVLFEWSLLFKRLQKKKIEGLLSGTK